MIAAPGGDGVFVAFVFAAAIGLLVTFVAIVTGMAPVETAAVCAPLSVGVLAFLPGLSARFARLPIGFEPPRTTAGDYGTSEPRRRARSTPTASPPRRGAAMSCSSAWSAAARW